MILPPQNPLHGQRHAIVIGANGSSASGLAPLIAPEAHDAPRMAAVLASPACGFHVQPFLGEQALMQPIRDAIETQMKAGTIDDSLIIYFAGHGTITQTAEGPDVVLVTTDTTLETIQDDPLACLRVGWLKTVLRGNTQMYPIGHVVVILDCCASGMIGQLGHQPLIGDPPAFRRMLVSTYSTHSAYEWNRTSLYTYHLLNALEGQAVDSFGAVTMERVHQYCSEKLAGTEQRCGLGGWDYTGRWQFAWYDLHRPKVVHAAQQIESDRLLTLRLEGFVGRVNELAAIREHIEAMRHTGGYVLIKAAAGEGKSSSIAKLIQAAGIAHTPHHFIALTTGREYQLGLLRAVVAQLILKHNRTMSYFPEESYPAMKAEFARILDELSKQGIHETIYLDGLDQLQPEIDGSRDLSFLPPQPPPGIVIVLGSRPDETLKPLEILHRVDYPLPPLSEADALALWRSVQTGVADSLLHDLYVSLKGNALFVHLAANTMRDQSAIDATSLIRQIEQNPQNLFGITLERMKGRSRAQWDTVWKPMLAILLVAQEPLQLDVMGDLLGHDHDTMQDAMWILGGLVSQGIDQQVTLHHLLFREYLAECVFNQREIKRWHQWMADWCARDLDAIWANTGDPIEQARRIYARHHYINHLSLAENWIVLWQIIDVGNYGEQKTRFDPSTRLYALDLDRGRESVIKAGQSLEDHIQHLPRLWKYSLLRTSLTSRVDQWTGKAFEVLAMLGRTHEALERIELLSHFPKQIEYWLRILPWCDIQQQRALIMRLDEAGTRFAGIDKIFTLTLDYPEQALAIADTTLTIAKTIANPRHRDTTLGTFAKAIATRGDIDHALTIANTIVDLSHRATTLGTIAKAIATRGDIDHALTIANTIVDLRQYITTRSAIAEAAATHGDIDRALTITKTIVDPWQRATTRSTIAEVAATHGDIDRALSIANTIANPRHRATTLDTIAEAIATRGDIDRALSITNTIADPRQRITTRSAIAKASATRGDIDRALSIANTIVDLSHRATTLGTIAEIAATHGNIDHALTIANTIDDLWQRFATCGVIAEATATRGDIDRALTIANTIANPRHRATIFGAIAKAAATHGDIDRALSIAKIITDPRQRAMTLGTIAEAAATHGDIDHALTIAKTIVDPRQRTTTLYAIAEAAATCDQQEDALAILNTLSIAKTIVDPRQRTMTHSTIAEATATRGDINRALTIANTIDDPRQRTMTLGVIAEAAATRGDINHALTIAKTIDDPRQRTMTLGVIAKATSTRGDIDRALTIVKTIDDPRQRDTARSAIAEAAGTRGDIDRALTIANTIADISQRTTTLGAIAEAAGTRGDIDRALTIANTIADISQRATTLGTIAKATATRGDIDRALTIAKTIVDISQRTITLSLIAETAATRGDIDRALTIANTIADISQRTITLNLIAETAVTRGDIDRALSIANPITEPSQRATTLGTIAKATATRGDINRALTITNTITDTWQRATTLGTIAETAVTRGDINRALTITSIIADLSHRAITLGIIAKAITTRGDINYALTIANTIADLSHRAMPLSVIAEATATHGNIGHALSIANTIDDLGQRFATCGVIAKAAAIHGNIDRALDIAKIITDSHQYATILEAIAEIAATHGDIDRALSIANTIDDLSHRATILEAIAEIAATHGNIDHALTIANTIDDLWQRTTTLYTIAEAAATCDQQEDALAILNTALTIINTIDNPRQRVDTLKRIVQIIQSITKISVILQQTWVHSTIADDLWAVTSLITPLLKDHSWLGTAILEGEAWVNDQLKRLG